MQHAVFDKTKAGHDNYRKHDATKIPADLDYSEANLPALSAEERENWWRRAADSPRRHISGLTGRQHCRHVRPVESARRKLIVTLSRPSRPRAYT